MQIKPSIILIALLSISGRAIAIPSSEQLPNVVISWDNATLQGIREAKLGAPMVARALAVVHTCMYDAWERLRLCSSGVTQNRPSLTMPAPVKHFVSVVLRALGDERHFGLEETIAITITKARV